MYKSVKVLQADLLHVFVLLLKYRLFVFITIIKCKLHCFQMLQGNYHILKVITQLFLFVLCRVVRAGHGGGSGIVFYC